MDNPFEMYVVDGQMQNRAPIGGVVGAEFTPRHLAQPSGSFSLPDDHPLNKRLLADDARVLVRYKGEHLMSGKIRSPKGKIVAGNSVLYELQDDWRWLVNTLAWVNPNNPAQASSLGATDTDGMGQAWLPGGPTTAGADGTIQGQSGYYQFPSNVDMTESVVKNLIRANFDRLNRWSRGLAAPFDARRYTIATDQGRGYSHRTAGDLPQVRNESIDTYILPLLKQAGLGIRLKQEVGATTVGIDVYQPKIYGQKLTVPSGIVTDGDWSYSSPNATNVLVGGPGDLAARLMRYFTANSASFTTRDVIEVFKDAAGGQIDWPETLADAYRVEKYMQLRADIAPTSYADVLAGMVKGASDALTDGAPTSGVSVTLSETDRFSYGGPKGVHVGDTVTIATGDTRALEFTDTLSECTLKLSNDKGLEVTPVVGDKILDPNLRYARGIVALAMNLRRRSTAK